MSDVQVGTQKRKRADIYDITEAQEIVTGITSTKEQAEEHLRALRTTIDNAFLSSERTSPVLLAQEQHIADLQTQGASLQSQLHAAKADANNCLSQLLESQELVTLLQTKSAATQAEMLGKIEACNQVANSQKERIASLERDNAALRTENTDLRSSLTNNTSSVETDELNAKLRRLQTENSRLQASLKSSLSSDDALIQAYKNASTQYMQLLDENSAIDKQLQDLQQRFDDLVEEGYTKDRQIRRLELAVAHNTGAITPAVPASSASSVLGNLSLGPVYTAGSSVPQPLSAQMTAGVPYCLAVDALRAAPLQANSPLVVPLAFTAAQEQQGHADPPASLTSNAANVSHPVDESAVGSEVVAMGSTVQYTRQSSGTDSDGGSSDQSESEDEDEGSDWDSMEVAESCDSLEHLGSAAPGSTVSGTEERVPALTKLLSVNDLRPDTPPSSPSPAPATWLSVATRSSAATAPPAVFDRNNTPSTPSKEETTVAPAVLDLSGPNVVSTRAPSAAMAAPLSTARARATPVPASASVPATVSIKSAAPNVREPSPASAANTQFRFTVSGPPDAETAAPPRVHPQAQELEHRVSKRSIGLSSSASSDNIVLQDPKTSAKTATLAVPRDRAPPRSSEEAFTKVVLSNVYYKTAPNTVRELAMTCGHIRKFSPMSNGNGYMIEYSKAEFARRALTELNDFVLDEARLWCRKFEEPTPWAEIASNSHVPNSWSSGAKAARYPAAAKASPDFPDSPVYTSGRTAANANHKTEVVLQDPVLGAKSPQKRTYDDTRLDARNDTRRAPKLCTLCRDAGLPNNIIYSHTADTCRMLPAPKVPKIVLADPVQVASSYGSRTTAYREYRDYSAHSGSSNNSRTHSNDRSNGYSNDRSNAYSNDRRNDSAGVSGGGTQQGVRTNTTKKNVGDSDIAAPAAPEVSLRDSVHRPLSSNR